MQEIIECAYSEIIVSQIRNQKLKAQGRRYSLDDKILALSIFKETDGQTKVASWSHILELYRMDQQMGRFSQLHKLTDLHVLPQKIKKMKVKYCTQFSAYICYCHENKSINQC
nr:unnamed protein product [Callosobruchus analis]